MITAEMMSQNEFRNLQMKLADKDEEICNLKKKLNSCTEEVAKNDALLKRFNELQRWVEEAKINQERSNNEQLAVIERQFKKLEKAELAVTSLRSDNHRLDDVNKCQAEQLKTFQRNEQGLLTDIEKLEITKKKLENELCNVKGQLREKCCAAEKLTGQLACKHEELLCARKKLEESAAAVDQLKDRCKALESSATCAKAKLEECQAAGGRLRVRCRDLESDLESARAALEDVKSRAIAAEARLRADADALAEQLECRARELRDSEAQRDEWKRRAAEERSTAARANACAAEARTACDRERCEAEAREQRLRRDVCERDEELRRRDEQLAAARQETEETTAAAAAMETRTRATEALLADVKRSAEAWERAQNEARERLEHEKAAVIAELNRKTADAAELERQVCRLRDEIRRAGCCRAPQDACGATSAPPSCRPLAEDRDVGRGGASSVVADDSFVSRLKRLYCDLEMSNKNITRRQ